MNIEKRYQLARKKLPIYWGELVKNDSVDIVWSDDGKEFLLFLVHSTEGRDLLLPLLALLDSLLLLSLVMFFQYRVGFRPKMLRFPVRWLVVGSLVGPFLLALAPV